MFFASFIKTQHLITQARMKLTRLGTELLIACLQLEGWAVTVGTSMEQEKIENGRTNCK
jgi:hypothetical protein